MSRPNQLWWRMGGGRLLCSTLGPPALVAIALESDTNGGSSGRAVLRLQAPVGATGWSVSPTGPWTPMKDLPEEWGLVPKPQPGDYQ